MEVISASLDMPLLGKKYVMSSLQLSTPCEDIDTCQRTYGPPQITFAADISGSMIDNMTTLRESLFALLDMAGKGTRLRIVVFDETAQTLVEEELQDQAKQIKDKLIYSLINWDRGTNLEVAISHCLTLSPLTSTSLSSTSLSSTSLTSTSLTSSTSTTSSAPLLNDPGIPDSTLNKDPNSDPHPLPASLPAAEHITSDDPETLLVFASDGVANIGRETSSELIQYARSFPSYVNHTVFTLGIRTNKWSDLNSDLLKDMALDSGGVFQLTETKEGIAKILGDMFAYHYFFRYLIHSLVCTSANGCRGEIKTAVGLRGSKLRADKPLTWIWEFPLTAEGPFTLSFSSQQRGSLHSTTQSISSQAEIASELQYFIILGCVLITPALDKTLHLDQLKQNHVTLSQIIERTGYQTLVPLLHSLQLCIDSFGTRVENPDLSLQSFTMSSGGGEDSIQVEQLRSSAVQFSQVQGHEDEPELYDSQKTVASETNKRIKLK
jgi:hypothetical protein